MGPLFCPILKRDGACNGPHFPMIFRWCPVLKWDGASKGPLHLGFVVFQVFVVGTLTIGQLPVLGVFYGYQGKARFYFAPFVI